LLLQTSVFYAQDKSSQVHKTKSSAIINGSKYYLHTVEKGQTLFAIAKFYKKEVNEIVLENPEAINGIKPGQVLRILVDKKEPVALNDTSNCIIHLVEKGETLYSITKKYNTTAERLRALNPELKENGLKAGQQLKVPSPYPKVKVPIAPLPPVDSKAVYKGEKKSEYNIALFLPFNLDAESTSDPEKPVGADPSSKTAIALKFYEGALLAIDSLKKLKFNAKVHVYDISDKDSGVISTILKKSELTQMDLIIGPLYGASFTPAAKFAKDHMIPIVSPFAKINKILFNNPYVCKVSPSEILQVEQMAHFVTDSFKLQNIIAVSSQNMEEYPIFNAFKRVANDGLQKAGRAAADTVKLVYNINALTGLLQPDKINVIVIPSNNQSFVSDVLNKLNVLNDKYKIVLFGMQKWLQYDNMDYEYFNELAVHIPSNGFIDYEKASTKNFIQEYRDRFKTEPDMYGFQGYDITYYFLSALQKYGSGFLNNLSENTTNGLETSFRFSQFPSDSGFENKSVFILKYHNYQLIKAN
ncbi:MAG TPA: LysM peptidoglycan-binding domain-containing protein, partial [Bacteroidia bacterium]|jgi:LysM repeat protein/ABC-type branched-subunit amino acid transport system substrate-binding protein|nr:LysM peptidoglycan-binding domain-containing protein [Bacteroidia bacterium]